MRTNDSEDLTRVGPGTVMGDLMREYWIPALRSDELESDGAPRRLLLLGEKLIAFRDTSGRVGMMEHQCPHRCASLFLGRNEQDGIRCIYHGWKFDVDGNCVDMPSVAAAHDFKHKIKAKAYRVHEKAGLVWVYMGQRDPVPALPMIEIMLAAQEDLDITFVQRSCNWMQSLEGDIDTSHFGFLHVGHLQPEDVPPGHPLEHTASERAPEYKVRDAAWGTTYGAHRAIHDLAGQPCTYWRFGNFLFPFWTQQPQGEFSRNVHARAWVPLDDHHTMFIFIRKRPGPKNAREPLNNGQPLGGSSPAAEYLPVNTDWLGRWKLKADESNDWLMDREAQRSNRIYSGIDNIHLQDQAVTESMGPITDHGKEHLGPGDMMISRTRRRLLQAARALRERGEAPPGVLQPEVFMGARSGYFTADPAEDWQKAYEREVAAAAGSTQKGPVPHAQS